MLCHGSSVFSTGTDQLQVVISKTLTGVECKRRTIENGETSMNRGKHSRARHRTARRPLLKPQMRHHLSLKRSSPCPLSVNIPAWVGSVLLLPRKTLSIYLHCLQRTLWGLAAGPGTSELVCSQDTGGCFLQNEWSTGERAKRNQERFAWKGRGPYAKDIAAAGSQRLIPVVPQSERYWYITPCL